MSLSALPCSSVCAELARQRPDLAEGCSTSLVGLDSGTEVEQRATILCRFSDATEVLCDAHEEKFLACSIRHIRFGRPLEKEEIRRLSREHRVEPRTR